MPPHSLTRCPCSSGNSYADCCARLHHGLAVAATAETLMRSRYSAFALRNSDYLLTTWHSSTRPASLSLEAEADLIWTRLEIHLVERGGPIDSEGTVEFTAHSRAGSDRYSQHEVSRFVRADKTWFYLDAHP